MAKRMKWLLTSFVAFFLAALFVLTGVTMLKANAQEEPEPEPELPAQGWYIVGNGAGYLKECSWTEFVEKYRVADSYTGDFTLPEMLMYPGDAFKLLYTDGTKETPDDTKWTADVVAQFDNIADNTALDFADGGLGNIEAVVSGYYTFKVSVIEIPEMQPIIELTYSRSDVEPPDITLYEMYVVGTIASHPTNNWPSLTDVATNCIKLEYDEDTDKWTATVTLIPTDEFKVYNLVTDAYYPSGVGNNYTGFDGEYVIEWGTGAPDIKVTPVAEPPVTE